METHGLYHFHKRKRLHQLTRVPEHSRVKQIVDKLIFVVSLIGPIMTIPQVWIIWAHQEAAGVSLVSWGTYIFTATFWLFYGILHKDKPIIFANSVWIFLDIAIVIGVILYG